MKHLHIARDLPLPTEAATQTFLIVGKRGSGKTSTAVRLAEQLHHAGVPFVVVDPVDVWWGLKAARDGGPGLPVYVFGGRRGDLPLEPTAGALMADVVVEHRIPVVLSVKHFTGGERARFVTDFAVRLFQRNTEPLHVFLEEAHELAPQQPYKGEEAMLGAIQRLWKLGRSSGLGGSAITQRPASLNKNITTQAEVLVVHRTIGPQDVAAIREWIRYHGEREDILAQLATLKTGEAFVWAPDFPEGRPIGLQRVQVLPRETFDSSATPKAGEHRQEPKQLAGVDLERLRTRMAATIEKAKAADPAELRKRVRDLEAELRKAHAEKPAPAAKEKRVEVPVLKDAQIKRMEATTKRLSRLGERLVDLGQAAASAAMDVAAALRARLALQPALAPRVPAPSLASLKPASRPAARRPDTAAAIGDPVAIDAPRARVLRALAWWRAAGVEQPTRHQVAFVAGYTVNGHFNNTLGTMRTEDLLDYPSGGTVALTPAGASAAGPAQDMPSREVLIEAVRAVLRDEPRRRVFDALLSARKPVTREELATAAGYTVNGHFNNLVGSLHTLGVTDYPGRGTVALGRLFEALP